MIVILMMFKPNDPCEQDILDTINIASKLGKNLKLLLTSRKNKQRQDSSATEEQSSEYVKTSKLDKMEIGREELIADN
jgi:hypothetical protein